MSSRVLLIEDDHNISASLSSYLAVEGYVVTAVDSLFAARGHIASEPAIIILDWMLPDGQGLDFLKEMRSGGCLVPVIMLTAKSELVDKVLGLESGADDYLTKPFEPRELLSRMRVRLRGTCAAIAKPKTLHFANIALDPQTRIAKFRGSAMELTKLEFDLLKLLIEQPGRVFTREEILNRVWGFENFPTTRTVDNHIVQLRQKTLASMFDTVRGIGYRLVNPEK